MQKAKLSRETLDGDYKGCNALQGVIVQLQLSIPGVSHPAFLRITGCRWHGLAPLPASPQSR